MTVPTLSLAARREAMKFGMAMAAMMPMIATTIRSSISEKPSCRLFFMFCSFKKSVTWLGSFPYGGARFFKIDNKIHARKKL